MNVFISVDMEGISGIVTSDQANPGHSEYQRFRRIMTAETNAAIEGALAGGATRVVVNDSHGGGTHLLIEDLNPAAELVGGRPRFLGAMQGLEPETDVAFLVGYHAMMETGAAILSHTIHGRVVSQLRLNENTVGELGLSAALAGAHGVPVTLVSGDRATAEEARALLGPVETVVVKEGYTRRSGRCLNPQVAHRLIREAAGRAARSNVKPFVVSRPISMHLVLQRPGMADMAELVPGSHRVDGLTISFTGDHMDTISRTLTAMIVLGAAML